MPEYSIMNTAQDFTLNKYNNAHSWICEDDNGDYWCVVRNTSDNMEVYKSEDSGQTWILQKTLTNSDWSNGNPLPSNHFQLVNLIGQNKVYLFICEIDTNKCYSWIFETNSGGSDSKDLDSVAININVTTESFIYWDNFNDTLFIIATYLLGEGTHYYGKILLNGTISSIGGLGNKGIVLDYYIDEITGIQWMFSEAATSEKFMINKAQSNVPMTSLDNVDIAFTKSYLIFGGITVDRSGHPIVGYLYNSGSNPQFKITKRDKDDLSNELLSTTYDLGSGSTNPTTFFIVVDGNNNIYVVYTDADDGEAYYIKYSGSWGTPTKISSDNDGKLCIPITRPKITDTQIPVIYQATV